MIRTLTIATFVLLTSFNASAESLRITPGLWESTMTTTNPMLGENTATTRDCIKEEEFDPRSLLQDAQECKLVDSTTTASTLTYSMVCDVEGGTAKVNGEYRIDGDRGEGGMQMEMSFGGQSMRMDSEFTARRIGDC